MVAELLLLLRVMGLPAPARAGRGKEARGGAGVAKQTGESLSAREVNRSSTCGGLDFFWGYMCARGSGDTHSLLRAGIDEDYDTEAANTILPL